MSDLKNYDGDPAEHIAIVGMSGRFPGARNVEEFWRNLRDGVESITFFTAEQLANDHLDPALLSNPQYVGADGLIDDMDMFDAEFFGIAPREAELMDPQHRLFLECAWELMEQAGYDSESYAGRVAVYGSANLSTYLVRNITSNPELRKTATSFQTLITNDKDFIATRVSFKMNLRGPSMSVATLCSSSFVAIHLGCQALLNYQCDLALAGAISLQVSRNEAFFYQEGGIGDPDGHCHAFDARASGTVSGSGIGLVALRRLEDALRDGDTIHAIIRGAAVNNDGAVKYSYTAPSAEGQAKVITEAITLADVNPRTVTYVETHGTGTRLGDPIEVEALTQAFRMGTQDKGFCAIGSVKTNIGHLVNAGGVASLIKTILALEHKQIPPSLNYERPNPEIDFANSPFFVNTQLRDWETNGFPRRAGVSSFGIGGTNVHIVVEEAPGLGPSGEARPWQLLLLSAKTPAALERQTANLLEHLRRHPESNLADVAFTLQVGRRGFDHRRALVCRDVEDAIAALDAPDPARVLTQVQESRNRSVAFLLPGLGEQYVRIGAELYQGEPAFREHLGRCAEILRPHLKLDLRTALYPADGEEDKAGRQLEQPAVARAALFAVEYALANLWIEWGVRPQALVGGDRVGEYVAANLAGIMTLEDALGLAAGVSGVVEKSRLNAPQIPCVSGVTGSWITEEQATDPHYWDKQQTADFAQAVQLVLAKPEQVLLEVGPGQTLGALVQQHPNKADQQVVLSSLPSGQNPQSDIAFALTTLGRLWLAGVHVDWNGLHTHDHRHRISLPTYPFERKRFWIEPQQDGRRATEEDRSTQTIHKKPDIADWFYIPSWKRSLLPTLTGGAMERAGWLLFIDECGLGSQLAKRLEQEGHLVVTVTPGAQFARLGERAFTVNPGQRADYEALLDALGALEERPATVVHLWSITRDRPAADEFERVQDLGFYSLLFLAQALGKRSFDTLRLVVVSNHLQEVTAGDVLQPEKATLLGPARVIPQEYPNVACRTIDVVLPDPEPAQERALVDYLRAELAGNATGSTVAYRGSQRWTQTFEPVRLDGSAKAASRLRDGGVYVIFDGLEGIGLALAEHLAQTVKEAKLLLTRQPASSAQTSPGLDTSEATVLVFDADVGDSDQVKAAIAEAEQQFGSLNGVIYAAGGFGQTPFRSIEELGKAECEQQFRAVIQGVQTLAQLLPGKELNFCLLTSSLSSVLGGLGLVAYAAAYNVLDALARQNSRPGAPPWLSANWDNWRLDEGRRARTPYDASLDELAITPGEGVEAFERILSCGGVSQMVVSTADLHARVERWVERRAAQEGGGAERKAITFHARPDLPTPYVAPRNETEQTLAGMWQELLGVEKVGVYDSFFELGGHSLLATQVVSRVRETFKMDLPLTNLFEQPTIALLAEYIEAVQWATQAQTTVPSQVGRREEIEL